MAEKIGVETTELEDIVGRTAHISDLADQIVTKITAVTANIPNLSSQGSFHSLVSKNDTNIGLGNFVGKAKEFQTLAEVFSRHVQNTLDGMINVDRALAIYVANKLLNSPEIDEETKQYIREEPEDAVSQMTTESEKERDAVKEKPLYGPPKPGVNPIFYGQDPNNNQFLASNNIYTLTDGNQYSNIPTLNPLQPQNPLQTPNPLQPQNLNNLLNQNTKGGKK